MAQNLTGYDFVWASPPCQGYCALKTMPRSTVQYFIPSHHNARNPPVSCPARSDHRLSRITPAKRVVRTSQRHSTPLLWCPAFSHHPDTPTF